MATLQTVQVLGVLTKVGTIILGIVQTAVVLRLLGPESYGVVSIVISLGALVGVSQHVGVVDAAIREIAVAPTPERRAAIFWASLWMRMVATIPLSLLLWLVAPWVSTRLYALPDMLTLVRLGSVFLILQAVQGILGGAYTGQRAFGLLYLYQLASAALNIPLFAGFVWWHGARGFFEAAIMATIVFCGLLVRSLRTALGGRVDHPTLPVMRSVIRDIAHTGFWTYVARMLSVAWQRVPVLLLGRWTSPEVVGLFNAALTFGSKLQLLAAALGEVNLAFLSNAFSRANGEFRRLAQRTLEDIGAITLLGALFLVLFADVLVPIVAGGEFAGVVPIVAAVTWGYAAFAFLDIATNTVFVPARQSHLRAACFLVLLVVTLVVMGVYRTSPLEGAQLGMLLGGIVSILVAVHLGRARLDLPLFPRTLALPLGLAAAASVSAGIVFPLRVVLFSALTLWTTWIAFPSLVVRLRQHIAARP